MTELPPLPPEAVPGVAVDEGLEVELPGPPIPPATPPVLVVELDGLNEDDRLLEAVDDERPVEDAVELPEVRDIREVEV